MMTLLLHTSTPTIHLGLADGDRLLAQDSFPVDRTLASTLADRIRQFLLTTNYALPTLQRIVVHAGPASAKSTAGRPGSFTSLRIGVTTANTLGYALGIPVVGVSGETPNLESLLGASKRVEQAAGNLVLPEYGQEPHIGPR